MIIIPANQQRIIPGAKIEHLEDGSLKISSDNNGWILFGPYTSLPAGIYKATSRSQSTNSSQSRIYWDISGNGRVYACGEFINDGVLTFKVPDIDGLEFRYMSSNAEFVHRHVEVEQVVLDREEYSTEKLEKILSQLIAEGFDPQCIFPIIDRIAEAGNPERAEGLRANYMSSYRLDATSGLGLPDTVDAILAAVHAADTARTSFKHDLALDRANVTAAVHRHDLAIIDIPPQIAPFQSADREEIERRGYKAEFLHANRLYRSFEDGKRSWQDNASLSTERPFQPLPPLTQAMNNCDLSFQRALARSGSMTAVCPITGEFVRATHGFCEHVIGLPQTFYRFEGKEVFYIATGGFINSKMFMYMPATGTIIPLEEPGLRWYDFKELVRAFNVSLVLYYEDVIRYLDAVPKYASVIGLNNIGHFFWNDLSGLSYMVDENLHLAISQIVTVKSQFLDYRPVFPQLESIPSTHIEDPHDVFAYFVKNHLTPIRFTDGIITDSYFHRLREAVGRKATSLGRAPDDAPRPLLWINVRAHNKIWVHQAAGYANIINATYERYGSASALLQGMPDCSELAAEIRKLVRPEVPLYDGLDLDQFDKINYAHDVDAYVCVVGAGLVLPTWLADRPGVAHAEHGHMDQLAWWDAVRPGAPKVLAPTKSQIRELGSGWYCNYEVDWQILADLLFSELDKKFATL